MNINILTAAIAGCVLLCSVCNAANIAILKENLPNARGHADPDQMAKVLLQAKHKVDLIDAKQLADSRAFNTDKYSVVILPYGSFFPAQVRENFLSFLRNGGDFISTGGYAFDEPAIRHNGKWITRSQAKELPVNKIQIGSGSDQGYLTGEWHMPERLPDFTKRWTGKMAGLKIPVVSGSSYTLEIDLSTNPTAKDYKRSILINGKAVYSIPALEDQTVKLDVSAEQIGKSKTLDLVFDAQLWSPNELVKNGDGRLLGISVKEVRLVPKDKQITIPDQTPLLAPINMRQGAPNDFLEWQPEQLGVFDAGYKLSKVAAIKSAPGQTVLPAGINLKGKFTGYAAAGTTGSDWYYTTLSERSRIIPLLQTTDQYGRYPGNAGALMVNYSGPYKGSIWAYFGIDNTDIFSGKTGAKLLLSLVDRMAQAAFIGELRPSMPCYRQGEAVSIIANMGNYSDEHARIAVECKIQNESGNIVFRDRKTVELAAAGSSETSFDWKPAMFGDDYYTSEVSLYSNNKLLDSKTTGFYVWNTDTLNKGPNLSYKDNYLHYNGIPRYLLGVQAFYPIKAVTTMDPADVERDFRTMSDMGVKVARTFTKSLDKRFIDSLVMASQRHGVIFFIEGMSDPTIDPESLKSECDYSAEIAERYKDISGMMVDIRNEPTFLRSPSEPPTEKGFIDYLKAKYGTTEALRSAWGNELGADETIETAKIALPRGEYSSVRARDAYRFFVKTGSFWAETISNAIRSKAPNRLITIGYLQWWPDMTMDPAATSDSLDFVNRHWYGPTNDLSTWEAQFIMSDRRYAGKAPSVGEFGSKTFPTFAESRHNYDTTDQQTERYLHMGHYALGLGGLFTSNWHYRDPQANIFPYGIIYSDWTPKPVAASYKLMALLFAKIKPKYVTPDTYLVLPDESRFGGDSGRIFEATQNAAKEMVNSSIRFGAIGEWDITKLPKEAKTLVLPAAYTISDAAYEFLVKWVKNGGKLYLSTDIEYNTDRKPDQTLGFKKLGSENIAFYSDPSELHVLNPKMKPGIRILNIPTENGETVLIGNETGRAADVEVSINNQLHKVTVAARRQGMLVYSNGKLAGLEAQGNVERNGKTLLKADCHFSMVSLDDMDISQSSKIALIAISKGKVTLGRQELSALAGEAQSGIWKTLQGYTSGTGKSVAISEALTGDIIVLASPSLLAKAGQDAANLLCK